jgi:hypothetical protein
VEAGFVKPTGEHGWLLFGLFDRAGNEVLASGAPWPNLPIRLARSPWGNRLLRAEAAAAAGPTFQVQAFVTSLQPLSVEQRDEVRQLFLAARSQVLAAYARRGP